MQKYLSLTSQTFKNISLIEYLIDINIEIKINNTATANIGTYVFIIDALT